MLNFKNLSIEIYYPHMSFYKKLQSMVAEKYNAVYSATIAPKPDLFVFLKKSDCNDIEEVKGACFGVTYAKNKKLFSEQYINDSFVNILSQKLDNSISKDRVAEVGSLVSINYPGAGKELVSLMYHILFTLGIDCALITATQKLVSILDTNGIMFVPLTKASKDCLPMKDQDKWGTYYTTIPTTGFIPVRNYINNLIIDHLKNIYNSYEKSCKFIKFQKPILLDSNITTSS